MQARAVLRRRFQSLGERAALAAAIVVVPAIVALGIDGDDGADDDWSDHGWVRVETGGEERADAELAPLVPLRRPVADHPAGHPPRDGAPRDGAPRTNPPRSP